MMFNLKQMFGMIGFFGPLIVLVSLVLSIGLMWLGWQYLNPTGFWEKLIMIILTFIGTAILFVIFSLLQLMIYMPMIIKRTMGKMQNQIGELFSEFSKSQQEDNKDDKDNKDYENIDLK